jgi:predicted nucleotidyltransferase
MGRVLGHTASDIDLSERTLRRYIGEGMLRARKVGSQVELPPAEDAYLRSHHELLRTLRASFRTERNVRVAVLFGSAATGEDTAGSDIDLLVSLHGDDFGYFAALRRRLAESLGRPVHVVLLEDAQKAPALLADALSEGRAVIDRDGLWQRLLARGDDIRELAARDDARLAAEAASAVAAARARLAAE